MLYRGERTNSARGDFDAARQTWSSSRGLSVHSGRIHGKPRARRPCDGSSAGIATRWGYWTAGIKIGGSGGQARVKAAAKYVALAEALSGYSGNRACCPVRSALKVTSALREHESVLFPAALVLAETGDLDDAAFGTEQAAKLENMLQSQTTSYARTYFGAVAFKQKRLGDALALFRDAQKLHDSWFAHLMLGRVSPQAGRFAERSGRSSRSV